MVSVAPSVGASPVSLPPHAAAVTAQTHERRRSLIREYTPLRVSPMSYIAKRRWNRPTASTSPSPLSPRRSGAASSPASQRARPPWPSSRSLGVRQPTIPRHLRILEEAGLIEAGRDAQRRPRRLVVGGPLREVDDWLGPFRAQWERRFDNLEAHLARMAATDPGPATKKTTKKSKPQTSNRRSPK